MVRQLADSKLLIKEETIFTLEAGTGRLALGQDLYREKVINRPRVFQWLLRVEPEAVSLQGRDLSLHAANDGARDVTACWPAARRRSFRCALSKACASATTCASCAMPRT